MLTRQTTLTQNISLYVSLLVLLFLHGWFWGSWLKGTAVHKDKLTKDLAAVKSAVEELRRDTANFKRTVDDTQEELSRRQAELDSLGTFLPSVKEKLFTIK